MGCVAGAAEGVAGAVVAGAVPVSDVDVQQHDEHGDEDKCGGGDAGEEMHT